VKKKICAGVIGLLVAAIMLGVTWWKSAKAIDLAQKESVRDLQSLQGKVVTMKGDVSVKFEDDAVYFDSQARSGYDGSRGLWMNFAEGEPSLWMMGGLLSGGGVVRGTLQLSEQGAGHFSAFGGELDNTEVIRLPILPLLLRTGAWSVGVAMVSYWVLFKLWRRGGSKSGDELR
jgi:hypothetical protein